MIVKHELRGPPRAGSEALFKLAEAPRQRGGGATQPALRLAPVDIYRYEELFGDTSVFGELADMPLMPEPVAPADDVTDADIHDRGPEERQPSDVPRPYTWRLSFQDIYNVAALGRRMNAGADATGERRQHQLASLVRVMNDEGRQTSLGGITLTAGTPADYRELPQHYYQHGDFGNLHHSGPGHS